MTQVHTPPQALHEAAVPGTTKPERMVRDGSVNHQATL